jgi:hypothetical protein
MLRAVLAAAFSATLVFGALAADGDISWDRVSGGSTTSSVQAGDISWDSAPAHPGA